MKKLRKIIKTWIVFLATTTVIYATTDILPEDRFGIKKVAILGAGFFLVVQILFIAYKKDKMQENIAEEKIKEKDINIKQINEEYENIPAIEKNTEIQIIEEPIFTEEDIVKIEKEEHDLFNVINTEIQIETLPDKMNTKKKNIRLKKEINLQADNKNMSGRSKRGNVKIVRERKNRVLHENEMKNKKIEVEEEIEENLIKSTSKTKKRAKAIAKEAKMKNKKPK